MSLVYKPLMVKLSVSQKNFEIPCGQQRGKFHINKYYLSHLCVEGEKLPAQDVNIICLLFPKSTGLAPFFIKLDSNTRTLNLAFSLPVAVTLVKGSGPVYLTGFFECRKVRIENFVKSEEPEKTKVTAESCKESEDSSAEEGNLVTSREATAKSRSCFHSSQIVNSFNKSASNPSVKIKRQWCANENETESDSDLSNDEYYHLCCDYSERQKLRAKKAAFQLKYDMSTMKDMLKKRKEEKCLPRTIQSLVRLSKVQFKTNNRKIVDELWEFAKTLN